MKMSFSSKAGIAAVVALFGALSSSPAALTYDITGGQLAFSPSDTWTIQSGRLDLDFFGILPHAPGTDRAVYSIQMFRLDVIDGSGTPRQLEALLDGTPITDGLDSSVPAAAQDIGLFNVYSDGLIDYFAGGFSVDLGPPDPGSSLGGPSLFGSEWTGTFPAPTDFSVTAFVELPARGLSGESTLMATIPEPSTGLLVLLAAPLLARRQRVGSRQV